MLVCLALYGCSTQPRSGDARRTAGDFVELQILAINDFHGNLEPPADDRIRVVP